MIAICVMALACTKDFLHVINVRVQANLKSLVIDVLLQVSVVDAMAAEALKWSVERVEEQVCGIVVAVDTPDKWPVPANVDI